ncbi:phosphotransferase-like protein [Enterovibrio nigricans]|nr:hypothetical protein [Enterovibrio nigricans]
MAQSGCMLVLDNAWGSDREKLNLLEALAGFEICLVGVRCHLLVASLREKERGDRALGLAESEYNLVHQHMRYDAEIDTTQQTPHSAARQLLNFLDSKPQLHGAKDTRAILKAYCRPTVV